MPFQAERAMDHVRALDFAREAGGEGERRAAGYVAGQFAAAGLHVEQKSLVGLHFRGRLARGLGWPVLAGLAVAVCVLTARGERAPAAALMPLAVLVWV